MRPNISKFLTIIPVLAITAGFACSSAQAADAGLNETQKAEVRQILKDFIKDNPEFVIEAYKSAQMKQQSDMLQAAKFKIKSNMAMLTSKDRPSVGDDDADVTVVEFFDYNCGYCKKAVEDIKKIHAEDKKVRFVFFDMPILGPTSFIAAQWAEAAHHQGKYFEFHTAVLEHNGALDDTALESIAEKVGMNVPQAKAEVSDEKNSLAEINKGIELGASIGIQGTPGFIIDGELFPGYLGEEGLKNAIAKAREDKKN